MFYDFYTPLLSSGFFGGKCVIMIDVYDEWIMSILANPNIKPNEHNARMIKIYHLLGLSKES